MKKWRVEILRRHSGLDPHFHVSKVITVEGRTESSVFNKTYKKYASPYCTIGKITEIKEEVKA